MLASCGKEVKIHEWPGGALIGGVSSINGVTFKGLSWSYPGNKLLAVPSGHCPILLQECSNNEEVDDDVFWADVLKGLNGGIESGIFPNTTENHLAIGLATGELLIYDISGQCSFKNYSSPPEPVIFLDYTFDDSLLAVACRNGRIYFYDNNGIVNTSLQIPFSTSVSAMMFHPHSNYCLIGGSKEGVLAIWDVRTAMVTFQSHEHDGVISGICMAPQEDIVISVGTDMKVLFYDLRSHSIANVFNFGIELTCAAYSRGNEDVLVGTSEGRIMCFDRRKPAVLKYSFESQKNSAVKCISFNVRSSTDPKCPELTLSGTPKRDITPINSMLELDAFVKNEVSVVSRMHAGMDKGIETEGSKLTEGNPDVLPLTMGEGSGVPLYQVVEENSLRALKQEIINANKEIMRKFMEDINDQFLKIRMEVSREFCHLEQIQNQKWKELQSKLSKLVSCERKEHRVSDSQISGASETYRVESSRFDVKRDSLLRKN